ncbi:hypothetical protein JTE90_011707 [Oedothorax gibbosus]|uniref:Uncharacterized protein n=1 Tax=Oedothorax gibbosus TaxID=931172 RepID=A0AAV6USW4_9ARAC|nr:hypothetical protein JTE90_011707 [Oedothorax gibbosus]
MGNAASAFKALYQRLVRRQRHRNRWVRDDKKELLPRASDNTRPTHRPIQKRIDEKVFDQLLQNQDDSKRRLEEPSLSFHDDLHRRYLAILNCVPPSSSKSNPTSTMAESFDSMASYIMKGTESMGINFESMEDEVEEEETTDSSGPHRRFTDNAASANIHDENATPAYDDEEGTTTDEDNVMDENNGNEDNAVAEGLMASAAVEDEFVLERFQVLVNTCNSFDASWCNDILLS